MNPNKVKSGNSNNLLNNKVPKIVLTAMAALTLAACSNNDASAKPDKSSEPKTEQSSKNTDQSSKDDLNFSDDTTQSSSEVESSSERQEVWSLKEFVGELKKAGFNVIDTDGSVGSSYYANVEINGYEGTVGASSTSNECLIDFSKSLGGGKSGTAHDKSELYEAADNIKKYISQK